MTRIKQLQIIIIIALIIHASCATAPTSSSGGETIPYLELGGEKGLLTKPIRISSYGYAFLGSIQLNNTRLPIIQGGNITSTGQEERYIYIIGSSGLYLAVKLTIPTGSRYGYTYIWWRHTLLIIAYSAVSYPYGGLVRISERILGIDILRKSIVFNLNEPIGAFPSTMAGLGSVFGGGRMVMANNRLYYMRTLETDMAAILSLDISNVSSPVFRVEKIITGYPVEELLNPYRPYRYGGALIFGAIAYYPDNSTYKALSLPRLNEIDSVVVAGRNYVLLVNETRDNAAHILVYDLERGVLRSDIRLGDIKGFLINPGRQGAVGDDYAVMYLSRINMGPVVLRVHLSGEPSVEMFSLPYGISIMSVFSTMNYVYVAVAADNEILYINLDTGRIHSVPTGIDELALIDGSYIDADGDGYAEVAAVLNKDNQYFYIALLGPGISNAGLDKATEAELLHPSPEPPMLAAALLALTIAVAAKHRTGGRAKGAGGM